MFYYAQINDNYEVINVHSLAQVSTNENYIEITEEQYINGELVGKFYNSLSNTFEIMTDSMGTTDNVQVDWTEMMLSTKLDNMQVEINSKADIDHIHNGYATVDHTHTGYVSSDDLQILEDVIDTKANATHTHSEYASVNHSHDDYATQTALDTLELEVDEKAEANHTHNEYASSTHTHTVSEIGAASSSHNHDSDYADINHNHNKDYSAIDHAHANYATVSSLNELSTTVSGKANMSHSHDNIYYTETEIDTKLASKSDSSHTHTGVYDTNGAAASALTSANAYTDSKIDALIGEGASITLDTIGEISSAIEDNQDAIDLLNSAIANKANVIDLNTHASDTELHITDVERNIWNAKSDFSGNYNDLTNKPSIPSVNGLASEDYVDEKVGTITVESIGALPNTTVIPTVPTNVSAFANDVGYLTEHQSLNGLATETYVDTQIDRIDIPNALSDLTTDSTHRVVTDAEKAVWNAKSNFSGSYNDLTDKPSIPSISGLATEAYVDEAVSTKANSSHTHSISNVSGLQSALDNKSDTAHNHNSSYDAKGSAESALSSAKEYTDTAIDTLSEVVADKANTTDLTSHVGNTTAHITSTERTNWNAAKTHANAAHAPANAEPNQNAFSNVVVNGTTISADSKTDTLTFVAGNNVTITPDATGDSITISSVNTVYTHPTTAGNKHIPAGGSSGQILRWSADGTAVWGSDNNTTYSVATQTADGLMSDTDKIKLDGIAEGANNYILPSAGTSLGGVKSGGDVTIASGVITVNDDSHNHIISNVDGLQSALDAKAASGHTHSDVYTETEVDTLLEGKANASHTHTIANITNLQSTLDGKAAASHGTHVSYSTTTPVMDGVASVGTASTVARSDHKHPTDTSRAAQTSLDSHTGNKSNPHNVTLSQLGLTATAAELNTLDGITATVTELNYMDGVTSNVQTQLNAKAASSHTHSYAGSSSAGGAATSANKLNTNAGDANIPVYFANGVPVACTSLDLNTTGSSASCTGNAATATNVAWSGVTSKPTYYDAKAIKGITRSGTTFTYTCMDGTTGTFTQQDNNTTYSTATTSANGLMSASDKAKLDGIASGANAYTLPTASSTLGGVKTTSTVTSNSGYTACPIISGVPYYKDTNTTYNLGSFGVTATAAEINTLDGITATTSELNYCDGVTSNIQTQLNNKHTKGDNVTVEKSGSTPYASLKVKDTSLETRIYKNANTTNDYGTIIQDYSSDGKRDALILRRNTSLGNKLTLKVQNADGTDVNYQIYGQHTPNLMSSNENGNCVIGWDNYDAGSGDTNIYGENVHIYARNADGSLPAGAVFVGRNSNNHTLINNAAHLDTENISDTYIYGRAVHIDTNDTNFIVDSIQLAHTDKASISSISSGWTYYGTASANTPTVRRYGKVVSLTGALTNTGAVTLNTTHVKVFTIPSGYRPSQDIIVLCQGSGANEFCLQIKTDGSVYIGRYGTSSFSSVAAEQWFPFHVSWVME